MNEKNNEKELEISSKNEKREKMNPCFKTLKESIIEWWKNINGFLGIIGWTLLYSLAPILSALALSFLLSAISNSIFINFISIPVLFVAALFSLYFLFKGSLALIIYVKNDYKGKAKTVYLEDSKDNVWQYIGISLLTLILVLLWSMLLIIPGIIFSIFYTFATYVLVFEDKKDMKALNRSRELVKNYFWPVLGRIALLSIIFIILFYILSIPLIFIAKGSSLYMIWNSILQIISLVFAPISVVYMSKIYKNLVKINK